MADQKPTEENTSKATPLAPAPATEVPAVMGATFAERAAAREGRKAVADDDAENKAVSSSQSKSRSTRRKG